MTVELYPIYLASEFAPDRNGFIFPDAEVLQPNWDHAFEAPFFNHPGWIFGVLKPDDLWVPSVNISIGIRWLFRKRQIIRAKNPNATWRGAVAAYKAYDLTSPKMRQFDEALQKLQQCK